MNRNIQLKIFYKVSGIILSISYGAYSFVGSFYDLPNLGKMNNMTGLFIAFIVFVGFVTWHFWDMSSEISNIYSKYPNLIVSPTYEFSKKPSKSYGEKSYILKKVPADKSLYLFYLEVKNRPISKEGNTALDVQCKFYFYKEGYLRHDIYGRWVDTPEYVKTGNYKNIDIRPNVDTMKLGMGFVVGHEGDYFYLVDGKELNDGSNEIVEDIPCLMNGEYIIAAEFSGQNFPAFHKVYKMKNLKFKNFEIEEMKNGNKWWENIKKKSEKIGLAQ